MPQALANDEERARAERALHNAHNAGDTDAARQLARAILEYDGGGRTESGAPIYGQGSNLPSATPTARQGAQFSWAENPAIPEYLRNRQIPQGLEAAARQAPTMVESFFPGLFVNLPGRLNQENYSGSGYARFLPGSGAYDAPEETLEERMQRDVERSRNPVYNWSAATPEGRITQATAGAFLEGGIAGAGISGARIAGRTGARFLSNLNPRRTALRPTLRDGRVPVAPSRGELEMGARDAFAEGVASGGAAGIGSAIGESAGPGAGAAASVVAGMGTGNIAFGRNPAEGNVRRILSQSYTSQDYAAARDVMLAAREAKIEITPIEALSFVAPDRSDALWQAYRSNIEMRGTIDPLQRTARTRGERFHDAFNAEIERVIGSDPMAPPRSPGQVQRAAAEGARSAIIRARNEVSEQIAPLYEVTRGQNLPMVVGEGGQRLPLVDRLRSDLQAALEGLPPNSDAADGVRDMIRRFEGVENVDMFDATLREINEAMRVGDPQRSAALNAANAVARPILETADNLVLASSRELANARVLRRRLQEETIAPIESALDAIANPTRRANAQAVVRDLVGTRAGPEIDPERLQLGFSAIIEHDADLAGEVLGIYLDDAVRRGFESDVAGRARINAPGEVARTLIGNPVTERNLRYMFTRLDEARNMEPGVSWQAFNNLLQNAQAASQAPAYGATSLARAAADSQESRRASGAQPQAFLGNIIAPLTQIGRGADEFFRQRAYDRIIIAFTSPNQADLEAIRRMAEAPVGSRAALALLPQFIAPQQAYQSQERNE